MNQLGYAGARAGGEARRMPSEADTKPNDEVGGKPHPNNQIKESKRQSANVHKLDPIGSISEKRSLIAALMTAMSVLA